jgi:hypothetical protein
MAASKNRNRKMNEETLQQIEQMANRIAEDLDPLQSPHIEVMYVQHVKALVDEVRRLQQMAGLVPNTENTPNPFRAPQRKEIKEGKFAD